MTPAQSHDHVHLPNDVHGVPDVCPVTFESNLPLWAVRWQQDQPRWTPSQRHHHWTGSKAIALEMAPNTVFEQAAGQREATLRIRVGHR